VQHFQRHSMGGNSKRGTGGGRESREEAAKRERSGLRRGLRASARGAQGVDGRQEAPMQPNAEGAKESSAKT